MTDPALSSRDVLANREQPWVRRKMPHRHKVRPGEVHAGEAEISGDMFVKARVAIALVTIVAFATGCARAPSIDEGRVLYRENGCASCHGLSGDGSGIAAASLISKPTDLRNPGVFKMGASETAISRTLAQGVSGAGGAIPALHATHHEFLMPKFDHLTEHERLSIALYVISLSKGS